MPSNMKWIYLLSTLDEQDIPLAVATYSNEAEADKARKRLSQAAVRVGVCRIPYYEAAKEEVNAQ